MTLNIGAATDSNIYRFLRDASNDTLYLQRVNTVLNTSNSIMAYTRAGRVGLSVKHPATALHLQSPDRPEDMDIYMGSNGPLGYRLHKTSAGNLDFVRGPVNAGSNVMSLTNDGLVGVGTATPATQLQVDGDTTHHGRIIVMDGQDGGPGRGLYMMSAADSNWALYMASAGNGKSLAGGPAVAGYDFAGDSLRVRLADDSNAGLIVENGAEQRLLSIRGSDGRTRFDGPVEFRDALDLGDSINVNRVVFDPVGSNPYFLEKRASNVDHHELRLTLNGSNNAAESFQIWDGAAMRHAFDAAGDAVHTSNVEVRGRLTAKSDVDVAHHVAVGGPSSSNDATVDVTSAQHAGLLLTGDATGAGGSSSSNVTAGAYVRLATLPPSSSTSSNLILARVLRAGERGDGHAYANTLANGSLLASSDRSALQFGTDGAVRATLDADGRLGLNTVTPTAALDVQGDVVVASNVRAVAFAGDGASLSNLDMNNAGLGLLDVRRGGTGAGHHTPHKLVVGDGSNALLSPSNLHWDVATDRLGIRTSAPTAELDVHGRGAFTGDVAIASNVTASSFTGDGSALSNLDMTNAGLGVLDVPRGGMGGTGTHAPSKVLVGDGSNAVLSPSDLHFDVASNRLGIRTSLPTAELDVHGDVAVSSNVKAAAFAGDGSAITNLDMNNAGLGTLDVRRGGTGSDYHVARKLLVGDGSNALLSPASLHYDRTNDRLGIKTAGPTAALDVAGDVRARSNLTVGSNLDVKHNARIMGDLTVSGTTVTLNTETKTTEQLSVTNHDTGPALVVDQSGTQPIAHFRDDSNTVVVINDGGLVGIGETNPTEKLHVSGNVVATGQVDAGSFAGDGSNLTNLDMGSAALGTLDVTRGGTGASSHAWDKLLVGRGSNAISSPADLHWDAHQKRLGIRTAVPKTTLDVEGGVAAASFTGVGSNVTDLDAANVKLGVLDVRRGGTGSGAHAQNKILVGDGSNALLSPVDLHYDVANNRLGIKTAQPTVELDVSGNARVSSNVTAASFSGVGSNVTNLDMHNATLGVLDVQRGGTGSGAHAPNKILVGDGSNALLSPVDLHYDVAYNRLGIKTAQPATELDVAGNARVSSNVTAASFTGVGSNVTHLDMNNATLGVLDVQRGGTGAGTHAPNKVLVGDGSNALLSPGDLHYDKTSNLFGVGTAAPTAKLDVNGDVNVSSNVTASSLAGVGSNVTHLDMNNATLGVLDVQRGGTGSGAHAPNKILVGDGSNALLSPVDLHYDVAYNRLGIKTAQPTTELDVAGNARVSSNVTAASFSGIGSNVTELNMSNATLGVLDVRRGGTGAGTHAPNKILVGDGSNALLSPGDLHYDTTSNLFGVGTAAPKATLDVNGDVNVSSNVTAASFAGVGSNLTELDMSSATLGVLDVQRGGTGSGAHAPNKILVGDGSNALLSPVDLHYDVAYNRLGIKTAQPTTELDVAGNARVSSNVTAASFTGVGSNVTELNMSNATLGVLDVQRGGTGSGTHAPNKVLVGDGSNALLSPVDLHYDATSNRLGIKTAQPTAELDVVGNARVSSNVTAASFIGDGSNVTNLDMRNAALGVLDVVRGGTGSGAHIADKILVGDGSNALLSPVDLHFDTTSNRLGIKTAQPTAELDVVGNARVSSNVTAASFNGDGSNVTNLDMGHAALGVLDVVRGGTGSGVHIANKILVGDGSNALLSPVDLHFDTTSNRLGIKTAQPTAELDVFGNARVSSNVTAASFSGVGSNVTNLDMDNAALGVLDVQRGGTGSGAHTADKILVGDGSNALLSPVDLHYDTTSNRLGIKTAQPTAELDVVGNARFTSNVSAASFNGNGSNVTNLNMSNAALGVLDVQRGGTGSGAHTANKILVGDGSNALLSPVDLHYDATSNRLGIKTAQPTAELDVFGNARVSSNVTAASFSGIGSNVTELNMSNATLGVLDVQRGGTGSGAHTANKILVGDGSNALLSPVDLHYDVANNRMGIKTAQPTAELDVAGNVRVSSNVTAASFAGDGSNVTNLDMSHATLGVLDVERGGTGSGAHAPNKILVGDGSNALLSPVDLHYDVANNRMGIKTAQPAAELDVAGNARVSSNVAAASFSGVGSNVTNLDMNNATLGVLDVPRGGTGAGSHATSKILVGDGSNALLSPQDLHYDILNGRLGIKTTAPRTDLDVLGNARFSCNVVAASFDGVGSNITELDMAKAALGVLDVRRGGTGSGAHTANKILVGDGSNAILSPADLHWDVLNGRLGVKTTVPTADVEVAGAMKVQSDVSAGSFSGVGSNIRELDMGNAALGVLDVRRGGTGSGAHAPDKLLVGHGSNALTSPASLHWDGSNDRLGINTTAPRVALDVVGDVRAASNVTAASFTGVGAALSQLDAGNVTRGVLDVSRGGTGTATQTTNKVMVGNGSNAVITPAALHWDVTNARLGLATTAPAALLDVAGNAIARSNLTVGSNVDVHGNAHLRGNLTVDGTTTTLNTDVKTTEQMRVTNHDSGPALIVNQTGAQPIAYFQDDSNIVLTVADGGLLGIGVTDPTEKLHIAGNALVSGDVTASAFWGDGSNITNLNMNHAALGVLDVTRGGTGSGSHTAQKLLVGDGSNALLSPADLHWDVAASRFGFKTNAPTVDFDVAADVTVRSNLHVNEDVRVAANAIVSSNVSAASFAGDGYDITNLNVNHATLGVLDVARGGTGAGTHAAHKLLVGDGSNTLKSPAELHWDGTNKRFGVGTSNPATELDVAGDAHVRSNMTAASFAGVGSNLTELDMSSAKLGVLDVQRGGTGAGAHAPEKLLVGAGSNPVVSPADLHWDRTNSRFGIKTTAPATALDVHGDVSVSSNVAAASFTGDGAGLSNLDMNNAALGVLDVARGGTGSGAHAPNKILVGDGSNAVLSPANLHWDGSNDRLGIRSAAPTATLDVGGDVRASAGMIAASFTGVGSNVTQLDMAHAALGVLDVTRGGTGSGAHAQNKILVGDGSNAVLSPADLHYDTASNLFGIGTTAPAAELDVHGDVKVSSNVTAASFTGVGSDVTELNMRNATLGVLDVARGGTGSGFHATDKLVVGAGSNALASPANLHWDGANDRLGVNTSAPAASLDVRGDAKVSSNVAAASFTGVGSNVTELNMSNATLGVLGVQRGGTGSATHAPNKVLVGDGSNAVLSPADLHYDTTSNFLGLRTAAPVSELDVHGAVNVTSNVKAASFAGVGSNITELDMSHASLGVLDVRRGGTGSGAHAANKVLVGDGSNAVLSPSGLHWDVANDRLGIRLAKPMAELDVAGGVHVWSNVAINCNVDVSGDAHVRGSLTVDGTTTTLNTETRTTDQLYVSNSNTGPALVVDQYGTQPIAHFRDDSNVVFVINDGGLIGVGEAFPTERLHVNGNVLATGDVTAASIFGDGSNITNLDMNNAAWGVLDVTRGGMGAGAHTSNKLLVGDGSNPVLSPADLHWDVTNARLGVRTSAPSAELDVAGFLNVSSGVTAASFAGNGSNLRDLDMANATLGVLDVTRGGMGAGAHTSNKLLVGDGSNPVLSPSDLHWDVVNARLGVRTSAPSAELDVAGFLNVSSGVSAASFAGNGSNLRDLDMANATLGVLDVARGGTGSGAHSRNKILVGDDSNAVLSPANLHWDLTAHRLGINAASPSAELDVSGNARISSNVAAGSFTGDGSRLSNLDVDSVRSGVLGVARGGTGAGFHTPHKLVVGSGSNALASPVNLHWDGSNDRLGINSSNPAAALDVTGDVIASAGVRAASFAGVGSNVTELNMSNATSGVLDVQRGGTGAGVHAANKILVGAGSNAVLSPANLHWDTTNARLGIKTANPVAVLDVDGDASVRGTTTFTDVNADSVAYPFGSSNARGSVFVRDGNDVSKSLAAGWDSSNDVATVQSYWGGASNLPMPLWMNPAGGNVKVGQSTLSVVGSNVGIHEPNPSYRLHVNGDIYASGQVTSMSDAREKENVRALTGALDAVSKMRGYRYQRIDEREQAQRELHELQQKHPQPRRERSRGTREGHAGDHVGFLAQELLDVVPEAVSYNKALDRYSVNYGNLTAVLAEAVKELLGRQQRTEKSLEALWRRVEEKQI